MQTPSRHTSSSTARNDKSRCLQLKVFITHWFANSWMQIPLWAQMGEYSNLVHSSSQFSIDGGVIISTGDVVVVPPIRRWKQFLVGTRLGIDVDAGAVVVRLLGITTTGLCSEASGLGMPGLGTPWLGMPGLGIPWLGMPGLGIPSLGMPRFGIPWLGIPGLGIPWLGMPGFGIPSLGIPRFGIPWLGMPGFGIPWLGIPESETDLVTRTLLSDFTVGGTTTSWTTWTFPGLISCTVATSSRSWLVRITGFPLDSNGTWIVIRPISAFGTTCAVVKTKHSSTGKHKSQTQFCFNRKWYSIAHLRPSDIVA